MQYQLRFGFQCFPVLFTPEAVGVARLGFLHFERMFPQRVFVVQQTFVRGTLSKMSAANYVFTDVFSLVWPKFFS